MYPPTGTVTLVFTDLEGSSRLWESFPAQMSQAMIRHDQLASEIIRRDNGYVFKTLGDGVCAVFATPQAAAAAAIDLQNAVHTEPWPIEARLKIRIGIHTGDVEFRDGDYFGHSVNLVARLMEAGHGGQTLMSAATWDVLESSPPQDGTIEYLGRHRLRGIHQIQHIYQLTAKDLPRQFPKLRSMEAMPNNLPEQVTSFVGREREMREIKALFERTRLLTLHGTGGSGKTRLSLQIGVDLLRFEEAVWFVEMEPVNEPKLVPSAVAAALGIQVGSQSPTDAIIEHLRDKSLVLILDNCEHVVDPVASLVDTLLKRLPGLRILVSSREALGVSGETLYAVPSLSVPKNLRHLTAEDLDKYGAVQLFIERARAANPQFDPKEQDPQAIAQLCARLDGIPLAIELAAARIRSMTLEQILSRLSDRFRLLTGGSRAAMPRQRTLRALVDWSYDLLEQPERDLLLRLSVFVGGWDLEAAETVCACDSIYAEDVLDLLCSLSEKSMLVRDTRDSANPRYRLLETVRQYAAERMLEDYLHDLSDLRQRHAEAYLVLAEKLAPKLIGAEAAVAFTRLDEEHDNIRAALVWFAEAGDGAEPGLRLVVALQRFWMTRGHLREGWERARIALRRKHGADDRIRTLALIVAAFCATSMGEVEDARACFNEALEAARNTGDRLQEARAFSGLAGLAGDYDDDYQTSLELNRKALAIRAEIGDKLGQAAGNYNLADLIIRSDPRLQDPLTAAEAIAEAESYFRNGLALFTQLADVKHQGICLNGLAVVAQKQDNLAAAQAHYLAALELFHEVSDTMWCGNLYKSLASINWQFGRRDDAAVLAGVGMDLHSSLGFVPPVKEQAWWDGVLGAMRDGMPADDLQRLLSQGCKMELDEALALAAATTGSTAFGMMAKS